MKKTLNAYYLITIYIHKHTHTHTHTHTDILNKFLYQCMTDFFVLVNFQEVIEKFGRFIGRNAALGRQNTPEEEEALKSGHYTF